MVFLKFFKNAKYKFTLYVLCGWIPLVIFSLLVTENRRERFLMAIAFLLLFLPLVNIKAFQKLFLSVSMGKRTFMVIVVALMCYAQISQRWMLLYPFVHFTMFTKPAADKTDKEVTYYEYEGSLANGSSIPINPTEVIPSLRQRRIEQRLSLLADTVTKKPVSANAGLYTQRLTTTLGAIGKLYNKKNPPDQILTVRMYKCQFNMDSYENNSSIKRTLIFETNLESEP